MRRRRSPRRFHALECAGALVLCEPLDDGAELGDLVGASARPRAVLGHSNWRDPALDAPDLW